MKTKIIFIFTLICNYFIFSQNQNFEIAKNTETKKNTTVNKSERPSIALVLSGGGARGFAHIPILQLLEELDIPIDLIVGNSAGALIGGYYAAGYTPEQITQKLTNLNWEEIFQDIPVSPYETYLGSHSREVSPLAIGIGKNFSLDIGKGLITGQKIYQIFKSDLIKIPSYVDFDTLPIPFRAMATDLTSGEQVILNNGDLAESMRASMSLPTIFEPFQIDKNFLIDGMAKNNIPVKVARDLGYDYVIVVDISVPLEEDPEKFNSNPVKAFTQMFYMQQDDKREQQNKYADIIITPDLEGYSTIDYLKCKEIITRGELCAKKIKPELENFRNSILPNKVTTKQAEQKKTLVTSSNRTLFETEKTIEPQKASVYENLAYPIPTEIHISGIENKELEKINKFFEKNIKDKPLDANSINSILDRIYKTGTYQNVKARLDNSNNQTVLEIIATPTKQSSSYLLVGATYEGTLAKDSSSFFSLSGDYQVRGLSGRGSTLSIKLTGINDFGFESLYIQPLGQKTYIGGHIAFDIDQHVFSSGFTNSQISAYRKEKFSGGLLFGIRFNDMHLLYMQSDFKRMFESETIPKEDMPIKTGSTIDYNIGYEFSNLNRITFPTKGFYVNVKNTEILPIADTTKPTESWMSPLPLIMLCSVDFTAALPLGSKCSLIITTFTGTDPTQTMTSVEGILPEYGYTLLDRRFLPQQQDITFFGNHKIAMSLSLQIQPKEQITIFGGQWFFSMTASACGIWEKYPEIIENYDSIEWSSHCGLGVRIKDTLGIRLRAGVGSHETGITPFVALDFGSMNY